MSEGPKKGPEKKESTGDPFDGVNWDEEIDAWDRSAAVPGAPNVHETSTTPPPIPTREERAPSTRPIGRPLYRPSPPGASTAEAPEAASPSTPADRGPTADGEPTSDGEPLADRAPMADEETDARAVVGDEGTPATPPPIGEPHIAQAAAPPVDIDLLGFDEGVGSTAHRAAAAPVDLLADPFHGLDVEPPPAQPLPGPRLLAPEKRWHDSEGETAVKNNAEVDRPVAARSDVPASSVPTSGVPSSEVRSSEVRSADIEEVSERGLIDLLGNDDGSERPPPASEGSRSERPAAEWVTANGDAWRARCERVANGARSYKKDARARGLVVAAELAAIAGDRARAIELAQEALDAAPGDPFAIRQLRQLFAADARWEDVAPLLELEATSGTTPSIKAHAAILAADAARLTRAAPEEASRLYEVAQRVAPSDVRPMVARALSAIAAGKAPPPLRWPADAAARPLAEALVRRAKSGEPSEDRQIAVLGQELAKFADPDVGVEGKLAGSLDALVGSPTLGGGARWLRIALDGARAKSRAQALERAAQAPAGRAQMEARLALALDVDDRPHAVESARALAMAHAEPAIRVALLATEVLTGETDAAAALAWISNKALGRALALASGTDAPPAFASGDSLDAAIRVARRLRSGGQVDPDLRARTSAAAQRGFQLADAIGTGVAHETMDALEGLVGWPADAEVDESLARMLIELAEGNRQGAATAARRAAAVDPTAFPPAEALLAFDEASRATNDAMEGSAEGIPRALDVARNSRDDVRATSLALQVTLHALRIGDLETARRATNVALDRGPGDPVAPFLAELRARRAGDFDGVVEAVRARGRASVDPAAKAANLVREILLLMGSDVQACIELGAEAAQLMPEDATVRALYERLAGEGAQGRAEYRAAIAFTLEGPAKTETLLDAAREAERRGALDDAETYASDAERAGAGAEATTLRRRVQSRGEGVTRLADELIEQARRTADPETQREIYEALADLDLYSRNDPASAIRWHRAILESAPGHLPSLRRLEHLLLGEGREDDYESVASELARALLPDARDAHAEIAVRLRLRRPGTAWDQTFDLIDAVTERDVPSLWATRLLDARARTVRDDRAQLRACDLLLQRLEHPIEVATIATRAAEAALRTGDTERAHAYLERALDADPLHPTALVSLAELRRHEGDMRGAAEAIETMAQAQGVSEHRLEDWHAAATLWIDKAGDLVRGRAALERAAEIDLGYGDVFERLVAIAHEANDSQVIANLYTRRLAQIEDRSARAQLQVEYARVLVGIGDHDAARSALAQALELAPGNLEVLTEGARLAENADDWPAYESHLLLLAQATPDAAARLDVWRELGALYLGPLANLKGAEQAFRKILAETPDDDDVLRKLVRVYVELGDGESAVETHQERVRLAVDPVARRTRLIELAELLDDVAGDPERALNALEQARAGDPADLVALGALGEFHAKHGRPDEVAPALDQAIADLRRRLEEDPGDPALLEPLAMILELRARRDASRVVRAVMTGMRGEPSQLIGAEDGAALPDIDPLLCPPELHPSIRAFLAKVGEALEKSVPVDLRALKATKLGTANPVLKAKIDAVARGFGLPDPDVVISRAMPFLCLPVGAKPFQIVIGDALITTEDETARRFAFARTMKLCGAHCAALIRVPADILAVHLDALLHHLHPQHPAPPIDPVRLDEVTKRLQRFLPRKEEAELRTLAAEVVARGLPRVEVLAAAAASWGDRIALLAVGDLAAALRGIAWTLGQKDMPPEDVEGRRAWVAQNAAARDLVAFALSDAYLEARRLAGVGDV